MLDPIIEQAAGRIETRFIRVLLLPALMLCVAVTAVVVTGIGWTTTDHWWSARSVELRVLLGLSAGAAVLVVANLIGGQLLGLLRICEGYWRSPLGRRLAARRKRRHQKIWDGLRPNDRYLRYPTSRAHVLPTAAGNLLVAAELHPLQRYQIDAVIAWPRLFPVLPDGMRAALVAARTALDAAVAVVAVGVLFTVATVPIAALTLPGWSVPLCLACGLAATVIGYRGVVRSAAPYAELVKASFDLYRGELLTALGWTRAGSLDAEMNQWKEIMQLWVQGSPQDPTRLGY